MTVPPLRAVIIGSDTLLVQCVEIWRAGGHELGAVVTADPRLLAWCRENGIATLPPGDDLAARLRALGAFDHLFAITWLDLLPADVLAVPRRSAINFHDGPLPRYAGLNATSWALMAGEREYAITWHTITPGIDAGEILWQEPVAIAADDTALTLNARCFEAAMTSFRPLVEGLASGTLQPRAQDFTARSYFGRNRRPPAAGVLDWRRPRSELVALVRALDFGGYRNPLVRPKVPVDGALYCPRSAAIEESALTGPPGAVLALDGDRLLVQAADGAVALAQWTCVEGRPASLAGIAAAHGLRAGVVLPLLDVERMVALTQAARAAAPHEAAWAARLARLEPVPVPWAEPAPPGSRPDVATLDVPVPDLGGADAAVAAVLAFFARATGRAGVGVAWTEPAVAAAVAGVEAAFASEVPLGVTLDPQQPFAAARAAVARELATVRALGTHPRDLAARLPELEAVLHRGALPVAVRLGSDRVGLDGHQLVVAVAADGRSLRLVHDTSVLDVPRAARLAAQLACFVAALAADPSTPLGQQPLMDHAERQRVLYGWNATARPVSAECIHTQFRRQAQRTPAAAAVTCRGTTFTYAELEGRARRLAARLQELGVGPDSKVGVYLGRTVHTPVALLGILEAGGAYVPLDPAYPQDRVLYMAEDAGLTAVVVDAAHAASFPLAGVPRVVVDDDASLGATGAERDDAVTPAHLAYVIYTSGSTGRPKGVMVQHGNVVNFFAGMDDRLGAEPGTWLAVTSLSFDISVLELLWTLTRGFHVVLYTGHETAGGSADAVASARQVAFSLFYFASDEGEGVAQKYDLLLQGARFADRNGFHAVWTPERHFHAFGGLYPNPSVASAAIAAVTERVGIRSGSVVLPLHHPIRIAEEWALVDNLSRGRVGISFAAGWQPDDFVLRPENFAERKQRMFEGIELVKRLWRGETARFKGPKGNDVEVRTLPRPVQPELPVWVTVAGNPDTYSEAGRVGAFVLTHLLGQSVEELGEKLALYRNAWRAAGHAGQPYVTLMLHTFVGDDAAAVKETVRGPMREYLRSAMDLVKRAAWSFPTFKDKLAGSGQSMDQVFAAGLSPDEVEALLDHAFERYYDTSGLFGTPESCLDMVRRLQALEIDEIACLIDYGVPSAQALAHLEHLLRLKQRVEVEVARAQAAQHGEEASVPALVARHGVTHFQCTPSMMTMLLADPRMPDALARLQRVMVGGEALPEPLARQLCAHVHAGAVLNMYGPTETTIWSTVGDVTPQELAAAGARIGRPIANTQVYVLDANLAPVPVGVAGELWIAGDGVVRGYHARPDLTDERFRPDPFRPAGGRMYRTGDLAAWCEDGALRFFGRIDHQVKIRGYRIELGEIEAALVAQGSVREAVVVAREDTPGDKRLVAYVVAAAPGTRCDVDALRAHLRAALPDFMVPAAIVQLDRLPLTPNKKIDRNALPAPDVVDRHRSTPFVAAEGELESAIAEIWRTALGVERVGANDNFFDLGGHSLLAVKVHRDVQQALGREFSITALFQFPTVGKLAAALAGDGGPSQRVQESNQRGEARRALLAQRGRPRR